MGEWIQNTYAYTRSDSAHGNFHIREEGNGDCLAHTATRGTAKQIVNDHRLAALVPQLIDRLRFLRNTAFALHVNDKHSGRMR